MFLNTLVGSNKINYSGKTAVTHDGKNYAYDTIIEKVLSLSSGLQAKLDIGESVVVYLPNSIDMLCLFLACLNTGIIFIPLEEKTPLDEIKNVLNISKAKTMIFSSCKLYELQTDNFSWPENVYHVGERNNLFSSENYETLFQDIDQFIPFYPQPDQPAMVIITSGTTGKPKCILIPYKNITILSTKNRFPIHPNSILLLTSHMSTGCCLLQILHIFNHGARLIMLNTVAIESIAKEISTNNVTLLSMSVFLFHELVHYKKITSGALGSLECCFTLGDIAPAQLKRKFYSLTRKPLISFYGMSETGPCIYNLGDNDQKLEALGTVIDGVEIKLLNKDDLPVKQGAVGQIWCKTARMMLGYLNNPSLTRESLKNGWFKTGDLAYKDSEGYYWFEGRIKHLIVLPTGDNVSPLEIEKIIIRHDAVKLSCVVGLPDRRNSWQKIVAFIQLHEGKALNSLQLHDYLKDKLIPYKIPKHIFFVDKFPLTKTEKIDRNQLIQYNID